MRVTSLGRREWDDCIVPCTDPRGRPYYWIGGSDFTFDPIPGTDTVATDAGYVSVTPLTADPTAREAMPALRAWGLER